MDPDNPRKSTRSAADMRDSDRERLRPWDRPDYQRQLKLADRLASPVQRPTWDQQHRHGGDVDLRRGSYNSSNSLARINKQHSPRTASPIFPWRGRPLYPSPYNSRTATPDQLDGIVARVTKPTVSTRGGVDLQGKEFEYIKTPKLKTLPVIHGLERRYQGQQCVTSAQLDAIVERLTRMTSAYHAKFAPNRNVWVDMEPGAHLVQQRKHQVVM